MSIQELGKTHIEQGELLSLYVEDPEQRGRFESITLYALKGFNISDIMADYYEHSLAPRKKSYASEVVMHDFVDTLVQGGLVTKPKDRVIHLGYIGRPCKRILEEYKHRQNPVEFVIAKIRNLIKNRCTGLFLSSGDYVSLMDPDFCSQEVRAKIHHRGEYLGMLSIGLMPSVRLELTDTDRRILKTHLQGMIDSSYSKEQLTVEEVYLIEEVTVQ